MYHKYQMMMRYLHENPVSNGGQLQAMQEIKPNKLLLLLLLLLLLIPPVKHLTAKSATIICSAVASENQ
jgi:hypothetical protein